MNTRRPPSRSRAGAAAGALAALMALAGCGGHSILDPKGSIGLTEKSLILTSFYVMMLIVVPVILLTLWFAWRYREGGSGRYQPDWGHSARIEIFCWGIPCAMIAYLGYLTWTTTHTLDPYKPLASANRPITVEVVSLDWKWLFIYPDQGIATINELAFPTNTPVNFKITSDTVMNSFFIPELGSQIFAMAGMQTQLHLIASRPGVFPGISAHFSGRGFSDMQFSAIATDRAGFDNWVANARKSGVALDAADYVKYAAPEEKAPVRYFSAVQPHLFNDIIAKYLGTAQSFHSSVKE